MATDIAFAVGILALLGKRVPPALRVLLLALAVIDDLGAIVVIALFYASGFAAYGLLIALLGVGLVLLLQRLGVRSKAAYIAPGITVWAGIYISGVHPTIAGVLIGLITPVRSWFGTEGFILAARERLEHLERAVRNEVTPSVALDLRKVNDARREALSPAESLITLLHPWVAFGIMPIFALANAGVTLDSAPLTDDSFLVAAAVAVGLVVGKPIGVLAGVWLTVRTGLGTLPAGIGGRHLIVLGIVAGVGFTMALFIAQLAFQDPALLDAAKLGILGASAVAGIAALALGRLMLSPTIAPTAAQSAYEAERSTEL